MISSSLTSNSVIIIAWVESAVDGVGGSTFTISFDEIVDWSGIKNCIDWCFKFSKFWEFEFSDDVSVWIWIFFISPAAAAAADENFLSAINLKIKI